MPSESAFDGTTNGGRLWAMKLLTTTSCGTFRRRPGREASRPVRCGSRVPFGSSGPDGVFTPYYSTTGRLTQWKQAPFNRHTIWMPKYLPV